MKHLAKFSLLAFMTSIFFLLNSCQKKEAEPEPQLTQQLAPAAVVAELRAMGMEIIETGKPVQIVGIYEIGPMELTASNVNDDIFELGHVFGATRYHFTNQSENEQTIAMNYKFDELTKSSEGFVAGSGNKFTAFFLTKLIRKNATTTSLEVFSGEWTSNGLKDVQQAFYTVDKSNDPDGLFVPVGSIRISKDEDGLSNRVSSLRLPADGMLAKPRESFSPKALTGL